MIALIKAEKYRQDAVAITTSRCPPDWPSVAQVFAGIYPHPVEAGDKVRLTIEIIDNGG